MSTTDEWIDITNEVILETNLERDDGTIIVPKWPGIGNLKVMRRGKKPIAVDSRMLKIGDYLTCEDISGPYNGTLIKVVGDYGCRVATSLGLILVAEISEVIAVMRNGALIYSRTP